MEQSPSWEANRFADSQEVPRVSSNLMVYYRSHRCPPPVPVLSQFDPVHTPTSHLLKYHLRLGLPNCLLPSGFRTKTLYTPLSPIRATCPAHLILDFIAQTILGEEYRLLSYSLCSFGVSIIYYKKYDVGLRGNQKRAFDSRYHCTGISSYYPVWLCPRQTAIVARLVNKFPVCIKFENYYPGCHWAPSWCRHTFIFFSREIHFFFQIENNFLKTVSYYVSGLNIFMSFSSHRL
jgi:hypothetical protein